MNSYGHLRKLKSILATCCLLTALTSCEVMEDPAFWQGVSNGLSGAASNGTYASSGSTYSSGSSSYSHTPTYTSYTPSYTNYSSSHNHEEQTEGDTSNSAVLRQAYEAEIDELDVEY